MLLSKDEEFRSELMGILGFFDMFEDNEKLKRKEVKKIIDVCHRYLKNKIPHN